MRVRLPSRGRGADQDISDPGDLPRLLGLHGERCEQETDSENDREPDQPHGTSMKDGWRGV